jgi:hypothetical protein
MSQHEKILKYLDRHPEGITPMDAFTALRITKLATRIWELTRMGHRFEKTLETHKNADGETVRFMRYRKAA